MLRILYKSVVFAAGITALILLGIGMSSFRPSRAHSTLHAAPEAADRAH